MKNFVSHPLWLVGFRPLFTLAFISGIVLPIVWALVYSGVLTLGQTGLNIIQWHAHEMLYGFGWAVLGGFLLTASKNWVKIRGMHGLPLVIVTFLWIIERITIWTVPGVTPSWMRFVLYNLFVLSIAGYVVGTLIWYRKNDSFKDNIFFIVALPLFLVAKHFTLTQEYYVYGTTMTIGLFRLAFAVMFERTMTQFMKNAKGIEVFRNPFLDGAIKVLVLTAVFQSFFPEKLAVLVLTLAGSLLLIRWILWKPQVGLQNFPIGIMYVGYFGLVLHFFFEAVKVSGSYAAIGTLSTHIFSFLCMGLIIPAMFIRICQGHTGRKLIFTRSDRFAILLMGVGAFFRLVATQVWPQHYSLWVSLASIGWSSCFLIIGWRLVPFLWQARIDGKIH